MAALRAGTLLLRSSVMRLATLTVFGAILGQSQTPLPTFLSRTDYDGDASAVTALGDFNNDGIVDIVNGEEGGVAVLFGSGNGTFTYGPVTGDLFATDCITVGDFNGDGNLDIAFGDNTNGYYVQVAYGNGDGTFTAGPIIDLPAYPNSITAADLNGDGLPDLVVGTDGALVFLNQGAGVFGPYTTLLPGDGVLTAAVGDVNGDGIPDIVAGTGVGAQVLLGIGGGNFESGQTITLQHVAGSVVLADMNGDGKPDLVATGGPDLFWTGIRVMPGKGDGTFANGQFVSVPGGAYGVLTGDMNGDGYPDLVMLQYTDDPLAVAFNNGKGAFSSPVSYPAPPSPTSFGLGSFHKAGVLDVEMSGLIPFDNFISILLNEGPGVFEDGSRIAMSAPPGPFVAADFNGDGLTDFAVLTSSGVSLYENSGKGLGPFHLANTIPLTDPTWIVTADFNKDGLPDLAVSLSAGGIVILLGEGGGQFSAPVTLASGPVTMFVTGDFNDDGHVDIAATSNQIFFGNGDGTFAAAQPMLAGKFLTNNPLTWLTPIRAVKDGPLDLAVVTEAYTYATFRTLLNKGAGVFALGTTKWASGQTTAQLAAARFNEAGLEDLVLTEGSSQSPVVNNGDGTFTVEPRLDCAAGCYLGDIPSTVGDFNGDGLADFAVITGDSVEVFLGNGDLTFQNPFFVGTSPGTSYVGWVKLQTSSPDPSYAFVVSSGDGLDIEIETSK